MPHSVKLSLAMPGLNIENWHLAQLQSEISYLTLFLRLIEEYIISLTQYRHYYPTNTRYHQISTFDILEMIAKLKVS